MKNMLQAFKCCYLEQGCCINCPFENNAQKCDNLSDNIEKIFNKIGEFIEFDNLQNIVKIIVKKGEECFENKN